MWVIWVLLLLPAWQPSEVMPKLSNTVQKCSASLRAGCKENRAAFLELVAGHCLVQTWAHAASPQQPGGLWGWGQCALSNPGAQLAEGMAGSQPIASLQR